MNNTIHKYPLTINGQQTIEMPRGAKILHLGLDPSGVPCIWAQVDTDKPMVKRQFFIYCTGENARFHENYIGTFVYGRLVLHVFN